MTATTDSVISDSNHSPSCSAERLDSDKMEEKTDLEGLEGVSEEDISFKDKTEAELINENCIKETEPMTEVLNMESLEESLEKDKEVGNESMEVDKIDGKETVIEVISTAGEGEVGEGKDVIIGDNEADNGKKEGISSARAIHLEKEAQLNAYLEALKPKPKQKSIKEMLMAMPGFKNLATLKPKMGGGEVRKDTDFVILDDEEEKKRMSKRQKQIEALKDRYVKHAHVEPPKPLKDRVKLKISKKEEDSQGIEHVVENEIDYVRSPLIEEEEAILPTERPLLRLSLREQIEKKKMAKYQEQLKVIAMDNEDCFEDEKGDVEEDFDEDEEGSEEDSDVEEEEEEEIEQLLGSSKQKRKKCRLIDDEAEDEDASANENDDNDDDSDDTSSSEDDDDDELDDNNESNIQSEINENSLPASAIANQEDDDSLCKTPTRASNNGSNGQSENETSENRICDDVDYTPKITSTAVLNQRTPSDFWIASNSNVSNRHPDELSPLIPRSHDVIGEMGKQQPENLTEALANVILEPKSKFDDLVDLCSGKFVTQASKSMTATAADDEDEFGDFDFGEDDDEEKSKEEDRCEVVKTPVAGPTRVLVDGITPKLSAKPTIARRSMQFDNEVVPTTTAAAKLSDESQSTKNDAEEEEDEEVVVRRKSLKKQKRLQFSDDEEEDEDPSKKDIPDESSGSSDEDDEVEEIEETQEPEEIPQVNNPFFNKYGKLKKKFVEDEAELSGSEEGSDDEDEKGLNHYDVEEGDNEEIDEELAKHQAERAHLKQMLVEDDKLIRNLQNRYLENGDLDIGGQRQKKMFRFGLDLDDDAHMGDSDEEDENDTETPEEIARKQAWIDKRKWISENSHLLEAETEESQSLLTSFKMGKKTIAKLESFFEASTNDSADAVNLVTTNQRQRKSIYEEIIKARKAVKKSESQSASDASNSLATTSSEPLNFATVGGIVGKEDSQDLNVDESSKSKSMTQPLLGGVSWTKQLQTTSISTKKGSFLTRGGIMFAKLAETSKPGDTVSNVKNNSRNFVFSHITPPNVEKTDGSNSRVKRPLNKASCKQQAKKIKVDRSFHNLDEASKGSSVFKFL